MERYIWICCLVLGLVASSRAIVQEIFEFEDALSAEQQDHWVWRSNASKLKTLRVTSLEGRVTAKLLLCIRPRGNHNNVTFYIDDIQYGNDGPSDKIKLKFEGIEIANITSLEKWHSGFEWNVLKNTGQVGPLINLLEGEYTLEVMVQTDAWGMELDYIRITTEHQLRSQPIICDAIALDD